MGHAGSMPGCETGGILIGHRLDDTTIQITRASPPGPRAKHGPFTFSRDTEFLQRYLDDLHHRSTGKEDYVGEWHVHRALDAPPSRTDRRSMRRIARRSNYAIDSPVLVIVEYTPRERRVHAYGFKVRPKRTQRELEILQSIAGD
jgi:integrative and conjugative element protein (TIGR02256 family)